MKMNVPDIFGRRFEDNSSDIEILIALLERIKFPEKKVEFIQKIQPPRHAVGYKGLCYHLRDKTIDMIAPSEEEERQVAKLAYFALQGLGPEHKKELKGYVPDSFLNAQLKEPEDSPAERKSRLEKLKSFVSRVNESKARAQEERHRKACLFKFLEEKYGLRKGADIIENNDRVKSNLHVFFAENHNHFTQHEGFHRLKSDLGITDDYRVIVSLDDLLCATDDKKHPLREEFEAYCQRSVPHDGDERGDSSPSPKNTGTRLI